MKYSGTRLILPHGWSDILCTARQNYLAPTLARGCRLPRIRSGPGWLTVFLKAIYASAARIANAHVVMTFFKFTSGWALGNPEVFSPNLLNAVMHAHSVIATTSNPLIEWPDSNPCRTHFKLIIYLGYHQSKLVLLRWRVFFFLAD